MLLKLFFLSAGCNSSLTAYEQPMSEWSAEISAIQMDV